MGKRWGAALAMLCLGLLLAVAGSTSAEGDTASVLEDLDATVAEIDQARASMSEGDSSQAADHARSARDLGRQANHALDPNASTALEERLDVLVERADDANASASAFATRAVAVEATVLGALALDHGSNDTDVPEPTANQTLAWLADHLAAPAGTSPAVERIRADQLADQHARRAALDALLAGRVLEEVAAAESMALQQTPGAHGHAERAQLLWDELGPRLARSIDDGAARGLDEGLGNLTARLSGVQAGRGELVGVTGPLAALTYHRSIDRMEAIAATIEHSLTIATRTMATEPDHAQTLLTDAEQLYRNHRANFLRHGERGTQPTDQAFQGLTQTVEQGTDEQTRRAVSTAVDEMRESASLGYGLRFTVQDVETDEDGNASIPLGFTNTDLDGTNSYRARLTYDPTHLTVEDVEVVWEQTNATVDRDEGELRLSSSSAAAAFGPTHLATLHVATNATEGPLAIEVASANFTTSEGSPAVVASTEGSIVDLHGDAKQPAGDDGHDHDHGHGQDDEAEVAEGRQDTEETRGSPLGLAALLAGLIAAAAIRRGT